jgi:hypothetical protein
MVKKRRRARSDDNCGSKDAANSESEQTQGKGPRPTLLDFLRGTYRRDEDLEAVLPSKDSPYSYHDLSEAETNALTTALEDGFGDVGVHDARPEPLPKNVKSGLLEHSFYCRPESEYVPDEGVGEFWQSDTDAPPPYEVFPLGFVAPRLRRYFQNQFDRFCAQLLRDNPEYVQAHFDRYFAYHVFGNFKFDPSRNMWLFQELGSQWLYQKPWYEVHALQFLDFIMMTAIDLEKHPYSLEEYPDSAILCIIDYAGKLGRLVEQYYWRFRFEGAAIAGEGARRSASAGGKAKAELHQLERAAWQAAALEIWARKQNLSKIAVAERIRIRFGEARTAKHIARYIAHP